MRISPVIVILVLFLCRSIDLAGQPLRILPLGNSLTKGVYCNNGTIVNCSTIPDSEMVGYRQTLYNALSNAGYTVDYVGNEIAGYALMSDYNHAGYPGFTSVQLATKMDDNNNYLMNSTTPDIVLLEIGTNDVYSGFTSIEGVRSILDEINQYETSSGKPVLVFLSKIIRFTQGSFNENLVNTFNTNLYNLYTQRKSAGDLIEWVDIGMDLVNRLEPTGDMKDELHPNQGGYNKMAQRWFNAINGINTAPVASSIPNQTVTQGTPFTVINLDNYIYDAEDADQYITWTLQTSPQHYTVVIDGNRQAAITPIDPDWTGSENIVFVATDRGKIITALKKSVSITVSFTINEMNHPPSVSIPADRETYVEDYFQLKLTAMDIDEGDNPVITVPILPEWLDYNAQTTTIYGIAENQHVGDHQVKVTVNDQLISVDSFFVVTVFPKSALPHPETESSVLVYPNPASQFLNIQCSEDHINPLTFRLYSVAGILIFSEPLRGKSTLLDLNRYILPAGAYFWDISGYGFPVKGKLMIR